MLEIEAEQRDKERRQLKDKVSQLERLNAKLEEERDEKQSRVMELQRMVSQRETERRELEYKVNRLELHNARIEEELSSQEQKLGLMDNEVRQRDREKADLKSKVSALQRQSEEARADKEDRERRLEELERDVADREAESQQLRNSISCLESLTDRMEMEKGETQQTLLELQELIEAKEAERKALEERVLALEARNKEIEEEKKDMEDRLREFDLSDTQRQAEQTANIWDGTDSSHDKNLEEKLTKLKELEAAITQREAEIDELKQTVESLQKRNAEVDEEKEAAQRELTELRQAAARREVDNQDLKQRLTQLEHAKEIILQEMAKKERNLADLERQIAEEKSKQQTQEGKLKPSGQSSETRELSQEHTVLDTGLALYRDAVTEEAKKTSHASAYTYTSLASIDRAVYDSQQAVSQPPGSEPVDKGGEQDGGATDKSVLSPSTPLPATDKYFPAPLSPTRSGFVLLTSPEMALKYKLQQKYVTREQEVQEKHVYLPEEVDLPVIEYDTPDAPAKQGGPAEVSPQTERNQSHLAESLSASQQREYLPATQQGKEEEISIPVAEEEITRAKQKLQEIEKEVVEKKAEKEYLRRSVEDLLSMMEAAKEDGGDGEDNDDVEHNHLLSDDDDDDSSDSDMSGEFFVELDPNELRHDTVDFTFGLAHNILLEAKADTGTDFSSNTDPKQPLEEVSLIKSKLEELEREVADKKAESERLKKTMDGLEQQKSRAAQEKQRTKQKLEDLQRSEAQLKQQLALLQLRSATAHDGNDDEDNDMGDGRGDVHAQDDPEDRHEDDVDQMTENDAQNLRDAIVY